MAKFIGTGDLRFYLYLSVSKIEMLYAQMYAPSGHKRKVLSALTPIGSASIESDSEEKVGIDRKVRLVEEELEQRQIIGTLQEPKTYFKATMPMRWGLFDDRGQRPDDEPALVYFSGFEKTEPLIVGLGGSSKHVVGHEGASGTWSRSSTPVIVRWLVSAVQRDSPPDLPQWGDNQREETELYEAMAIALHYLKPPTQDLEFVAKTLAIGTLFGLEHFTGVPSARVILGTPLYVAQAHPLPDENTWGLDNQW